jgi:cobalamin synthase
MVGLRNFMWVFPIFGAVFGIMLFIFPVMNWYYDASYYVNSSYWIFGLVYYRYIGADIIDPRVFEINFTSNLNLLIVSFITMILISVAVIYLIIAGISSMKKPRYNKKFMTRTSIGTILLFAGSILFLLGASWPTTPHSLPYPPVSRVWNLFNGGFSTYAPLIGGGITLLGIPLYYNVMKTRVERSVKGKESGLITKGFKEKTEVKKYVWVIPIIGVIIGIITFLAPAISFNLTTY